MVAIGFLMYDLCVTPVAIAWDFPMSGWLLHPGATERGGAHRDGVAHMGERRVLSRAPRSKHPRVGGWRYVGS